MQIQFYCSKIDKFKNNKNAYEVPLPRGYVSPAFTKVNK
jgi:hypothetical protein